MSNDAQREYWDARARSWARRADAISAFSDVYGGPAMDALGAEPGWRVLDIGCGPGVTAIALAGRVAPNGEAVGTDISAVMVEEAQQRATAAGVDNVRFQVADAETDHLGDDFDGVFSRFGVMFFADPGAAFANIGRALRPGGRLSVAVWGRIEDNPWLFVPTIAAAPMLDPSFQPPPPGAPGPFSLCDPDRVKTILEGAGLVDVGIDPVEASRFVPAGDSRTLGIVQLLETGPLADKFDVANDDDRQRVIEAVREVIESYRVDDGWSIPGRSLTVTASRPSR